MRRISLAMMLPEEVTALESLRVWKRDEGASAVWARGEDVWVIDRAPPAELPRLVRWSLGVTKRPKDVRIRRVDPPAQDSGAAEDR